MRIGVLTALTMIAFAGNSLLCRLALKDTTIDAATFTAVRIASGALILMAVVRRRGGGARPMAAGSWAAAAMLFIYAAGFSFAYRELSAATGALILFGAVQLTMIGCGLWSGERLRGLQLAGLAAALGGLVYLLLPGPSAPSLRDAASMLAAGMVWGIYSLLGHGSEDPTQSMAGNFMRAVPFAAVLCLAFSRDAAGDPLGVFYAVLSGAVTSGLGYALWYAVLPALKATSAAAIQLCVPALAAAGGVVLLAEPMTSRLLLASAAILGGIALTIVHSGKARN